MDGSWGHLYEMLPLTLDARLVERVARRLAALITTLQPLVEAAAIPAERAAAAPSEARGPWRTWRRGAVDAPRAAGDSRRGGTGSSRPEPGDRGRPDTGGRAPGLPGAGGCGDPASGSRARGVASTRHDERGPARWKAISSPPARRWRCRSAFHIVFAAVGVAMPLLMVLAEGAGAAPATPVHLELAKRWAKGTAILFAVGAVSGTVLSFELGLLWPRFMEFAGPIIGMPFSLEGFAFFTEAIFLGIYLYGWDRVAPGPPRERRRRRAERRGLGVLRHARQRLDERAGRVRRGRRRAVDVDPFAAMFPPGWAHEVAAHDARGLRRDRLRASRASTRSSCCATASAVPPQGARRSRSASARSRRSCSRSRATSPRGRWRRRNP